MNILNEISAIGQRMKQEQLSLKDSVIETTQVNVSDEQIDGLDRLIYNHCMNKKALADFFGKSRNTFSKILTDLEHKEIIGNPIFQNKNHLYTRFDIQSIMNELKQPRYKDTYEARIIVTENHKGGTGKSTTTLTLATAAALDLHLNARICIIDLDPQGSIGNNLIRSINEDDVFLTITDILLKEYEPQGDYAQYIQSGYSEETIISKISFSTHLPNLDVITAFPTDDRFTDTYWGISKEERHKLLVRFRDTVLPILKSQYDLIFIDTPPQDSPIIWSINEAADALLVPITPREYDFASTTNYMLTIAERLKQLPSQGKNIKWFKVLAVNVDDKSQHEARTLAKLVRTVQDKFLTTNIKHSEAFVVSAEKGRTILDIKKSEEFCSAKQFDIAEMSVYSVYQQFINEIKTISLKSE
ncbi:ParA-like ATPase involved in chromosome/plasmid partitioning or cellulose biosynthesis protein BcsQ (ParA) (PDB:6NOO) [Commensalibacter communis]|uniref:ParA-like ATPase involved in chromosome/plasmid partitioning or cellulose biosynthesis protein BcsQ (ParA) n=1 Tax=Commensalibacter communis TaxID=2972786 RepID=A0A9W4TR24_9PROT|nr:ParA family protein [Commensalibacter communis]CAI3955040.1 ParA-like ATPase involved in chromosome/plasmid partitioning or cellulose biosynthesis protein BcsQ (ParA) (PDB:6NOO) [Commensalibacter communis]CAI3957179.1 ParA-like ATPase involved in chromosome/plasmid partitioning or cellulose biosynthesis protein BcsQ (ParA) (PDB:6NOO) [Commensalibacter communis]CAI3958620.1 ParA-like ATPase involved in chromosome/plasmid partitioning or cellulose biosynthesis protein BcsQ (ParA) (PDB:6NOO) [Co